MKKIVSMLLMLVLLMSALPLMASAADTDIVDTGEMLTVSVQVNSDKTVTATWNKITDAYYYVVWFLAYDPNYYAAAKGEFIQIGSNRGVNNTEPCTYTFGKNYTLDYAFGSSDYRIHVKAYGSTSNQIAEGYSSVFHTYIPMLASPTITLNSDGTASWTAVPDAKEYNIALYDENEMFAGGSSSYKNLTYDFSAGLTKGKSFYAEVFARNRDDGYRDSAPAKSSVIHYAP